MIIPTENTAMQIHVAKYITMKIRKSHSNEKHSQQFIKNII